VRFAKHDHVVETFAAYDLRDLVTYRPSPSLEGFAALDRLYEALAPSRKSDVRALFRNQPMSEQT
jgi:hypothetical protein